MAPPEVASATWLCTDGALEDKRTGSPANSEKNVMQNMGLANPTKVGVEQDRETPFDFVKSGSKVQNRA
jgi:hypothetical protein